MTDPAFELYKQTKEYHKKLRETSVPNYMQLEEEDSVKDKYLEYCRIRRERGPELDEFIEEFKTWPHEDQMAWFLGDTTTPLVLCYSLKSQFNRDILINPKVKAIFVPSHINKLDSRQLFDFILSLAQKVRTSIINNSISSPILRRIISDTIHEQSFEGFERILAESGGEIEPLIKNIEYLNAITPSFLANPSKELLDLPLEEIDEVVEYHLKSIDIHDPDNKTFDAKINKWISQKRQYFIDVFKSNDVSSAWDMAIIYLVIYLLNRPWCDSVEKEVFDGFLDNPVFPELRPICEAKVAEVSKMLKEFDESPKEVIAGKPNDVGFDRPDDLVPVQNPEKEGESEGQPNTTQSLQKNEKKNNAFVFELPNDFLNYQNQEQDRENKIGELEDDVINAGVLAFTDIIVALTYQYRKDNGAPVSFLVKEKDNLQLVADILAGKNRTNKNDVKWVNPNDKETEKTVLYLAFKLFKNQKGKYQRAYRLLLPEIQPSIKKDYASYGRSANSGLRQEINSILERPRKK